MSLTIAFIVALVGVVALYDVWTLWRRGYTTTISYVLKKYSLRFPIIPFLIGVLAGHLFFQNEPPSRKCEPVVEVP